MPVSQAFDTLASRTYGLPELYFIIDAECYKIVPVVVEYFFVSNPTVANALDNLIPLAYFLDGINIILLFRRKF